MARVRAKECLGQHHKLRAVASRLGGEARHLVDGLDEVE